MFGPRSLLVGWGDNSSHQTNVPADLNDIVAVAGGNYHSIGLRHDGSLIAWGYNGDGQTSLPAIPLRLVSISAGDFHSLALRADGSVIGWGNDWFGQTNIPATVVNAIGIASGYHHGLALIPAPALRLRSWSSGLVIEWSGPGVLQWAPALSGPYKDLPGFLQSFTNSDFSLPAVFFRLRR
ncbi:MAG: hypothetical protein HY735_00805 [Verrucomicrobia bacterium]|nr:hypothetical protein [Verrucomicrobiota bacterium]